MKAKSFKCSLKGSEKFTKSEFSLILKIYHYNMFRRVSFSMIYNK